MDNRALWFHKWSPLLNVLLLVVSIGLVVFAYRGHGSVAFNLPAGSSVQLNGKHVDLNTPLPIRPGNYYYTVSGPRLTKEPVAFSVKPFEKKVITAQQVPEHSAQDIATSLIPSFGSYGPSQLVNATWLHDNTWLVGLLGPGTSQPVAFNFSGGSWHVAYRTYNGPSEKTGLPADVAAYLTAQEAPHEH